MGSGQATLQGTTEAMPLAAGMEGVLRTIMRTKFAWRLTPERGTTLDSAGCHRRQRSRPRFATARWRQADRLTDAFYRWAKLEETLAHDGELCAAPGAELDRVDDRVPNDLDRERDYALDAQRGSLA